MRPTIEYDPTVDGAYVWFVDIDSRARDVAREVWPKDLNDHIGLLFDHQGKLLGIELQPASLYLNAETLETR